MSSDTVDDLHAAEDQIGVARSYLEHLAHDLHLFHARGEFADCRKEACVFARKALEDLSSYCRPSCEQDDDGAWLCDPHCGCPGQHDAAHDDRS